MKIIYWATIYFLAINIITFILFWIDKLKAVKHRWRIKEFTLLLFCYLGGGIGGLLGMLFLRHKTKKTKFQILVPLSVILYAAIIFIAYRNFNGLWAFNNI